MNNNNEVATHWKTVGTVLWGGLIFIISTIVQLLSMMAWLKYQGRPMSALASAMYDGNGLAIAAISAMVVTLIAVYFVIKLKKGSDIIHYLALKPLRLRMIPIWVLGLFVIMGLATVVSLYNPGSKSVEFMLDIYASANPKYLLFLGVVIAAPISEEVLFRGFLFKGLQHSTLGVAGTIVLTSAAWALLHLQYEYLYIAIIFILGLFFGFARYQSKSLYLPILLHATYNFGAVVETALSS